MVMFMRGIKVTDEDLKRFKRNISKIVTNKDGGLSLNDEQRKHVLLFDNGELLVSESFAVDPSFFILKEIAKRKGFAISNQYLVSLKDIRNLYELLDKGASSSKDLMPVEQQVSKLIYECGELYASDLHVKVYDLEADIFIRKDGDMHLLRQIEAPVAHAILASLYNNADDADATYKLNSYQAARIIASRSRLSLPSNIQSIRLQFNPLGQGGRYLIARFLYVDKHKSSTVLRPVDFGFHPIQERAFSRMRKLPIGINIISGPTGSGKSTTLKNLLELLYVEKNKKVNIISIEDPPEYEIEGTAQLPITNVETEQERGEEYRKAITAALRSDPDIIMPGEARDAEVINLLFTAAMTGHQVWTSLHANNALAIFDRLRDQGVDDFKLTDPELITGLVAQRLIKKLCSTCSLSMDEFLTLGGELSQQDLIVIDGYLDNVRFPNNAGCKHCSGGYTGRTIIAEVIEPDSKLLNLIVSGQREDAIKYWLNNLSGMSMKEHAWLKVISGTVSLFDATAKVSGMERITEERKNNLLSFC